MVSLPAKPMDIWTSNTGQEWSTCEHCKTAITRDGFAAWYHVTNNDRYCPSEIERNL